MPRISLLSRPQTASLMHSHAWFHPLTPINQTKSTVSLVSINAS